MDKRMSAENDKLCEANLNNVSFIDVLLLSSSVYNRLLNDVAALAQTSEKLIRVVKNHQEHIMYLYDVIMTMQKNALDSSYDVMLESLRTTKQEKLN